jgi:tRNA(fMet)-specific endonuclease VapC
VRARYLLDTNIVAALLRAPQGPVAQRLGRAGDEAVCTSIVVAAELRFGARKSGSPRLARQLEAVLAALPVLPLEAPADRHHAALREALERRGTPIGPDLLIAAHALALGLTVVTADTAEFTRVPDLAVEDWTA